MGLATLAELRGEIVLLAGVKGNPDFTPLLINRRINHSQRYVQTELNGLGMKRWEASQVITAGLTNGAYNSPTTNVKKVAIGTTYFPNMLESPKSIIEIHVNDSADPASHGIAREVSVNNFEEQLLNPFTTPTLTKPVFIRLNQFVWLAPSTITAATAYYYKAVADLSSDASITEIPVEFEDFIIKKAVLELKNMKGEVQEMQIRQAELDKELREAYNKFLGKTQEEQRIDIQNKSKLS